MLGGIAEGRTEVTRLPGQRRLPGNARGAAAPWAWQWSGSAETSLTVHGRGLHGLAAPGRVLDMGNAGTAIRLSMGLLAGQRFESVLTGDASLRSRPMERVARPLRQMGADILTTDGKPPVTVRPVPALARHRLRIADGQRAGEVRHPAGRSVCRRHDDGHRAGTHARPHRAHAARLRRAGARPPARACGWRAGRSSSGARVDVPGDISSAAFFLVAGCAGGAATDSWSRTWASIPRAPASSTS